MKEDVSWEPAYRQGNGCGVMVGFWESYSQDGLGREFIGDSCRYWCTSVSSSACGYGLLPRMLDSGVLLYVVEQRSRLNKSVSTGDTSWGWAEWQQRVLWFIGSCGFFSDPFSSSALCFIIDWIPFEEVATLKCSSKWQKTMWGWELGPEIDCERFWKHFISMCSVSVFADWTLTLKPTVLRLVRLCDLFFFPKLSPPPAIGRQSCSLWRAQRFESIVLQCRLSSWSSAVHCDVKGRSLFLLILLFLLNPLLNAWEEADFWGKKVFHIIRKVGEENAQSRNRFLGYAWRITQIQGRAQNLGLSLNILSDSSPN